MTVVMVAIPAAAPGLPLERLLVLADNIVFEPLRTTATSLNLKMLESLCHLEKGPYPEQM